MPVVEREETRARTELGAAQKDTARELGAKLSSLKGIVWVGVGLFVFGLASLVWPPLKVVIGSVTTSAALMLGGVALMVLPSLIVGNELLILGGVGVAVGGWFLAHRHGHLRGMVAASAGRPEHRAPVQPSHQSPVPVISHQQPASSITFHVSRNTHPRHHEHKPHSETAAPPPLQRGLAAYRRLIGTASSPCARSSRAAKPRQPEAISQAEFYTEMLAIKDRMHADHLALLEKLDANHRELLAALERQVTRINALESGLARVDERTRK